MSKNTYDFITTGGGKLYIATYNSDGTKNPLTYFGVTDNVTISQSAEYLTKPDTEGKVQGTAKKVLKKREVTLKFATSEISPKMLGLALNGKVGTISQSAQTGVSVTLTGVKKGGVYSVGYSNLENVSIDSKVEGTDYAVDYLAGTIEILQDGSINDGDDVSVTFDVKAFEGGSVEAFTEGQVEAELIFVSAPLVGSKYRYTFFKVSISADGDIDLKSDDFAVLGFSGSVLSINQTDANLSSYFRVEELPAN